MSEIHYSKIQHVSVIKNKESNSLEFNASKGYVVEVINKNQEQYCFSKYFLNRISQIKTDIGFVICLGQPGCGKSSILNQLLGLNSFGETQIDENENQDQYKGVLFQNTKNMFMFNRPIFFRQRKINIFFIELRLFYDNSKDDEVLLNMALMLSSIFLVPVHDVSELGQSLNFVTKIKQTFQTQTGSIKEFLPKIIVLQQSNFDGQFQDQSGANITGQQLLTKYLYNNHETLTLEEKKNNQTYSKSVQINFSSWCSQLKSRRSKQLDNKQFNSSNFDATMLINFAETILNDINQNNQLNLDQAMITCIEDEFIVIYNDSLEVLLKKLGEHFPNESSFKSMEEMSESVKDIKDSVMLRFYDLKQFQSELTQNRFDEYFKKIQSVLTEKINEMQQVNLHKCLGFSTKKINETQKLTEDLTGDSNFSIKDLEIICKEYNISLNDIGLSTIGSLRYKPIVDLLVETQDQIGQLFIEELSEMQNLTQLNYKQLKSELDGRNNQKKDWDKNHQLVQDQLEKAKQEQHNLYQKSKALAQFDDQIAQSKIMLEKLTQRNQELTRLLQLSIQKRRKCCCCY